MEHATIWLLIAIALALAVVWAVSRRTPGKADDVIARGLWLRFLRYLRTLFPVLLVVVLTGCWGTLKVAGYKKATKTKTEYGLMIDARGKYSDSEAAAVGDLLDKIRGSGGSVTIDLPEPPEDY